MAKTFDNKRLQYLQESVQHAIERVDLLLHTEAAFKHFSCNQFDLAGGLSVYDFSIDPSIIKRRATHILDDGNHDYFLSTILQGQARISQDGTSFLQTPGSLALMTGGLPYTTNYSERTRRIIIRIPEQMFRERLVNSEKCVSIGRLPNTGLGKVVIDMLKSISSEAERLALTDQYTLTQSLLDLTGALTRASIKPRQAKRDTRHAELLSRILSYLEAHFMEHEMTPERIAKANSISIRYLHSLFRQSGTTVQRWVWERRLRAARKDLLDPSLAQKRISDIAFQRGFTDTAHFSRSFRNRFGISPSKLRHLAAESDHQNLAS